MRRTIHEKWAYGRTCRDLIRLIAEVAGYVAKFGAVIALPVGTFFLVTYLSAVSAPFPVSASALPTLLVVLTLTCGLVVCIFALTTLWVLEPIWPFWTKALRRGTPNLRVHVERPHWIIPALTEYGTVYLPFVLLWVCGLVSAVTNWQPSASIWLTILIACLCAGFVGASLLFYFQPRLVHSANGSRRFRESLVFAAQGSLQSVATLLLLTPYIAVMDALGHWQDPRGIVLLIVILIVHLFANTGRIGRFKLGGACMVMLLFFLLQTGGVSSFGAISLRMLGIGGGIPCDITLRTFDPSSGQSVVNVERGCLLITTGNEVALHPAKNAAAGACSLAQVLGHKNGKASMWSVDIYPQSAIVKTSILTQRIEAGGS